MHSLTSSLSLHVFLQHLSAEKSAILLKAHFVVTLLYFVSRGRPVFYVDNLKNYKTKLPDNPNPWIETIKFAINTPETHAMKSVRALLQAESMYGENEGIFLRAAQLTADTFADATSVTESHPGWNQTGIGYDQTWEN